MAQRKDSPNSKGGGNAKSAGKGGGKSASGGANVEVAGNTTIHHEKASPGGRSRGETSHADRS